MSDTFTTAEYVSYCYNVFGYDLGLMIHTTEFITQKIYYAKGDKYGQDLMSKNPNSKNREDIVYCYTNKGRKIYTLNDFYIFANDGDTVLPHEIIIDYDFGHYEIKFDNPYNLLIPVLDKVIEYSKLLQYKWQLYGTKQGRGIKIKLIFSPYNFDFRNNKHKEIKDLIQTKIGGELKLSGSMCSLCYPYKKGQEPIHAKTGNKLYLLKEG